MGILDKLFKGTFLDQQQEKNEIEEVILREAMVPTNVFLTEYDVWIEKGMHQGLLSHLRECHDARKLDPKSQVNLYFHEATHSNGFYFRAESPWNTKDYNFLIHLWSQKLKAQKYVQNHATKEVVEKNDLLRSTEEIFLKPSLRFRREVPYSQLFGNVFLEHRLKDGETELVKVMVHTYTDMNYKRPYDYEDFISELFLP